ncbi:DUF262 domain-containing protein [Microbacterium sp. CJ88]|uniref:DUF262 domain-containing protein n=1 Tax=Microbacterium sp. CJ88 TaxID=3445672 RepID=UPI003F656B14
MNESRVTTFAQLIGGGDGAIKRVEIPLIQRDYAQGRTDPATSQIRSAFLEVLHSALSADEPQEIGLDFVYGDVESDSGTLRPLDGQQRLTTLFLLHWYIAHRAGVDLASQAWTEFTYATRASARLFCARLVGFPPPVDCDAPTDWIRDQSWYQYVWRHDPTIQSMLTMIETIHQRFGDEDVAQLWRRIADAHRPAVSFHLLPINEMGAPEDLYIKMNSRGKPLTPFENFKARLEADIAPIDPRKTFAHRIDGAWADTFWPYRGDDDIIDDELLRYLRFLIEICEWRDGHIKQGPIEPRAEKLFDERNPRARDHLAYVIDAFDTWTGVDPSAYFSQLFTSGRAVRTSAGPMPLFAATEGRTDLFENCVFTYGETRGSTRVFSFGQQLLLGAVLAYRRSVSTEADTELRERLRVIRNLIDASENEIRLDRMPAMLAEVERIAVDGLTDEATAFNRAQFDDELLKARIRAIYPEMESALFALEDTVILRGSLVAFELDPDSLPRRAEAFVRAFGDAANWTLLTAALLAAAPYARPRDRERRSFQFGVGQDGNLASWRAVLAIGSRDALSQTREALGAVLDQVAPGEPVEAGLTALRSRSLREAEMAGEFDWRYYLTKYDSMREGKSGIYFGRDGELGYSLCMLNKSQLNSYYRDPYLLAAWRESRIGDLADDPWFTGYEWGERWLTFRRSGTRLRCRANGYEIAPPTGREHQEALARVASTLGARDGLMPVPQRAAERHILDAVDRIQVGANLMAALAAEGL